MSTYRLSLLPLGALVVLACAHPTAPPSSPGTAIRAGNAASHEALASRPAYSGEPRLVVDTMAGEPVEIGGPGPVRLVELWATWCQPCGPATARARPVLARHPQVVVYAVALDTDREAVARYIAASAPLGAPLMYPGGAAAAARRGLDQVPMFMALDARGRVAGTVTGLSPGLGPALDRLLNQAEGSGGRRD